MKCKSVKCIFIVYLLIVTIKYTNSVDLDQMLCNTVSDLGLLFSQVIMCIIIFPYYILNLTVFSHLNA